MPKKTENPNEEAKKYIGRKVKLVGKHPHAGQIGTIVSFDYLPLLKAIRPKVKFDDLNYVPDSAYVTKPEQMVLLDELQEKTLKDAKTKSKKTVKQTEKPEEVQKIETKDNPTTQAINDYYRKNGINKQTLQTLQTLRPLDALEDKLEKDEHGYYKKPDNRIIIKAFYVWRGIKSNVAASLNCSRPTLNKWIDEDEELQKALIDATEYGLDHAESKLNELMDGVLVKDYDFTGKPVVYERAPDGNSLRYYLSTKGKHRGFVTKTETELSGGIKLEPIEFHYHAPEAPNIPEEQQNE